MDKVSKGPTSMKRYGDLFDQIVSFENLCKAAKKCFKGKKNKKATIEFYYNFEAEVIRLSEELLSWQYLPRPYRQFEIREPKPRKICASDFRDRVVHHAICNILDPIFEKRLIYDTYACRVGKGVHIALKRCQTFTRKERYFLKCDIKKYFESIDHGIMKMILRKMIKDKKVLQLLDIIIDHSVSNSHPDKGLPIGNLTSQHFANLYLGELDHYLKEEIRVKGYLRYMDDFICFADDKNRLNQILLKIRRFCDDKLKLSLKEKVVRIAPISEGVPFLGFRIYPNLIRIQRQNLVRMRRKIKLREHDYLKGKIDEKYFLNSVNSLIAHISHANSVCLRRNDFEKLLGLA